MGPDVRAIDVEHAPVDATLLVEREVQTAQEALEEALARPAPIPSVHRLPLPVPVRHVAPWRTAVEHPEHPVEHQPVLAPASAARLRREQIDDAFPPLVSELVSLAGFAIDASTAAHRCCHCRPPCRPAASGISSHGATQQAPNK